MLELRNVRKTYRTKAGEVHALDGVSLTFTSSGLVFISGKSGCGKTTLLNVIGGLDGIDGGEMFVQDKNFSTFSAKDYDNYRNSFVGFIFQEYNLLSEYTVEYNIKIAMELQGVPVDEIAFEKLLKDVEIEDLRNRKPSELSGGQRQRVAIARALVKQPRIIMADEPTGALDSGTGIQVLETLKKLSKEKLVIVVSHDNEFAERYADRIVRLVDGKVVEDISFTEKELQGNINERENALVVKDGADLSETEKDLLANAIKTRKKIEITEKMSFRDKQTTGEIAKETTEPISFKKSKMKLKTSAYLGVKSLTVKPIRLILTILISAFAFAVFGVFDTIANFSTQKCLVNRLRETPSTITTTVEYIVDHNADDEYDLKVSDKTVATLSAKTGGKVKGIFNFHENTAGSVWYTQNITELSTPNVVLGKRYYSNSINGFIEFDRAEEIQENGKFKDFDYSIALGRYPKVPNKEAFEEGVYEVAISSYLADSILYYLNGQKLNKKEVKTHKDLLDCTISVYQDVYRIVGIINCEKIPAKYDPIKNSTPYNEQLLALLDDYDAFINSGAHKCLFVAKGFRDAIKKKNQTANIFYLGNTDQTLTLENDEKGKQLYNYAYNSADYDEKNVYRFDGVYPEKGNPILANDEILIHSRNLENIFSSEISKIKDLAIKRDVQILLNDLESSDQATAHDRFHRALQLLEKTKVEPITATVGMQSTKTGKTVTKQVRIAGFYFNVDTEKYTLSSQYKLMMTASLMNEFSVYSDQGDYSQILFSKQSVRKGTNAIAQYLMSEKGLSLTWYNNSVLTMIQENKPLVNQTAELFLYVALALAVFSVFMLYNYISTSIANKRRSVGVLRALGAGGKDIFRIFLCESLLIGLINGILANGICILGCALVNSYIMNTMQIPLAFALFGARQILLILAVSIVTAIISSALPILKISKKKPVDLITRS